MIIMNKDINEPCGNGHASQNHEKWSVESHLYQVPCIDNDFVAESNNDRSGVFSKGFFYRKCLGFLPKTHLRIRNTDNTR